MGPYMGEELIIRDNYHGHRYGVGPHENGAYKESVLIGLGQIIKGASGQEAL